MIWQITPRCPGNKQMEVWVSYWPLLVWTHSPNLKPCQHNLTITPRCPGNKHMEVWVRNLPLLVWTHSPKMQACEHDPTITPRCLEIQTDGGTAAIMSLLTPFCIIIGWSITVHPQMHMPFRLTYCCITRFHINSFSFQLETWGTLCSGKQWMSLPLSSYPCGHSRLLTSSVHTTHVTNNVNITNNVCTAVQLQPYNRSQDNMWKSCLQSRLWGASWKLWGVTRLMPSKLC